MSGIYENDPEAVQQYTAGITDDAAVWDEVAAKATAAADNLRGAARPWKEEWAPDGAHDEAVKSLAGNLDAFADMATAEAERLRTLAADTTQAAADGVDMDEANAEVFRSVDIIELSETQERRAS